ncbi:alpha/beta fold hydrolase [Bradyrhizobium sp. PRIMUS42]|uniref:alpha/beta fold hydrolase n=1 Tax=Bradyrhizobium sp. PRIMUS42 TaxID=2908926 RepID=UPI001FF5678B|nr:alpha/beta hydrolase [Bradyrhizobium sp. PRIMUS42]MCJ9729647.1 alpha/beta hydrolase [Bradyrhizobium sp. PRIMUS42]
MKFETITLDIDGVRTVVRVIGEGDPVFALHGAATIEGQEWARALAAHFRIFLPFHPGFGDSGTAPHVCGMQDLVIHNLHLVDALGLERPHLVGHSMGGWMAAELAAFAGERFGRLVLNAPAGLNHPDHQGPDPRAIPPEEFPGYLAHRVEIAAQYFPGGALAPSPQEFEAARNKEGAALTNILKACGPGHPNLIRWLRRIPNETLIVWGDKDRLVLPGQAELWAKSIPNAQVFIVPGVGHFAMQEDPSCIDVIGDFIQSGRSGGATSAVSY